MSIQTWLYSTCSTCYIAFYFVLQVNIALYTILLCVTGQNRLVYNSTLCYRSISPCIQFYFMLQVNIALYTTLFCVTGIQLTVSDISRY